MYTLVAVEVIPLIYLALGLTLIGLFSRYKIFLLLAIGAIITLMYEYNDIVDPHAGVDVIIVCLAGWVLFNVYAALVGSIDE